jgi:hypothetical protein
LPRPNKIKKFPNSVKVPFSESSDDSEDEETSPVPNNVQAPPNSAGRVPSESSNSAEDEETLNITDNIQSNFEAEEEHLIEDEKKDPDFVPPTSASSIQASRKKGDRVAGTKPRKEVPLTKLDLANSLEFLTSRCAK